ncbi:MAG: ABC transporter substrate-binding protein, partial [Planctomycetales bacterium]
VRPQPYFKEVRFKVIRDSNAALLDLKGGGGIEEMMLTPNQWRTQTDSDVFYKNNTKAHGVEHVYFYFGWNNKSPFFSDARARKAMSFAFDHEEMLKTLRFGLDDPCVGIFHPESRWAPKKPTVPYQRDVNKAKRLLQEAGWIDRDKDGVREKMINGVSRNFEFSILVISRPDRIAICELLKKNLAEIGVVCRIRPLEFTVLQAQTRTHNFQAYFGGWGTGAYPDTGDNLWKTNASRNFVQYANPKVDRLYDLAKKELDDEKRRQMFGEIHTILYEDQPYTWLYFRNAYYGFNKNLRGYQFSPRGPFNYGPGAGSLWKPRIKK